MKLLTIVLLAGMLAGSTGCAYGHSLRVGKNKVMVLKNDNLLFGILREAHVCTVSDKGLSNCSSDENP